MCTEIRTHFLGGTDDSDVSFVGFIDSRCRSDWGPRPFWVTREECEVPGFPATSPSLVTRLGFGSFFWAAARFLCVFFLCAVGADVAARRVDCCVGKAALNFLVSSLSAFLFFSTHLTLFSYPFFFFFKLFSRNWLTIIDIEKLQKIFTTDFSIISDSICPIKMCRFVMGLCDSLG